MWFALFQSAKFVWFGGALRYDDIEGLEKCIDGLWWMFTVFFQFGMGFQHASFSSVLPSAHVL